MTAPRGRIVCIAGQIGSGANVVTRALAGLVPGATGAVTVDGKPMRLGSVPHCVERNVLFVSDDRAAEGLFPQMSVLDNLVATRLSTPRASACCHGPRCGGWAPISPTGSASTGSG